MNHLALGLAYQRRGVPAYVPWVGGAPVPVVFDFLTDRAWVAGQERILSQFVTVLRASTATFVGSNGVLQAAGNNVLRNDYNPLTNALKGTLREGAATNVLAYSEQFDNAAWIKYQSTVTANAATAPDGLSTADKIVPSTANDAHAVLVTPTLTAAAYTASVWLKAAGYTWSLIEFRAADYTPSGYAFINLSTGAVGANSGLSSIFVESFSGGWFRVSVSTTATAETWVMAIGVSSSDATFAYVGDGTSGIYAWGAQLELGPNATSYIPTTTGPASRAADAISIATNLLPLQATGTLFAEFSAPAVTPAVYDCVAALDDGTINERVILYVNPGLTVGGYVVDGGVPQAQIGDVGLAVNTVHRVAMRYAANDFAISINGGTVATDAAGTIPTVNGLYFGNLAAVTALHLRQVSLDTRLFTNAQLQAISA